MSHNTEISCLIFCCATTFSSDDVREWCFHERVHCSVPHWHAHERTLHCNKMINYIHLMRWFQCCGWLVLTTQLTSTMQRTMTEIPVVKKFSSNKFFNATKQPCKQRVWSWNELQQSNAAIGDLSAISNTTSLNSHCLPFPSTWHFQYYIRPCSRNSALPFPSLSHYWLHSN